jgi:hypothetical protein
MSNVVKFSINGDTNADQVADRAKKAVSGFDKQVEGIGNKFKNSFKDIFLSFLGPMALVGGGIALIGKLISENQKKQEDANQAAIDGTNKLMSAEDRYFARKRENEKQSKEAIEQAKEQRETTTRLFLQNDPRAEQVVKGAKELQRIDSFISRASLSGFADDPKIQEKVFKIIAEDIKRNPGEAESKLGDSDFRSPQGFSNVIGVGSNPVMEAMASQLEEAKKTNDLLSQLVTSGGGRTSSWLDAPAGAASTAAPSRAALLRGK